MRARVVFAVLAASLVVGVMYDLGNVSKVMRSAGKDDPAWAQIRRSLAERSPAFGGIIALSPAIENEFRVVLVPIVRNGDTQNEAARGAAMTAAIASVFAKHVYPVAARGSTESVTRWGNLKALLLQRLATISTASCADYGTRSVARFGDDENAAALGEAIYRAVIDAYKTSDSAKHPLADENTARAQYAKAMRSAQPPFSEEELKAFDTLDNESKPRQCNLTLRLAQAIDRLDPSSKAVIFRYWMTRTE
jgi:hypothetical protein